MSSAISVVKIFNNSAIVQNNAISQVVDLSRYSTEGFFSLQIEITGAGNVDVIWASSNDKSEYITPAGTVDIFTAFGASSGPGSNGKDISSFDPLLSKYIKFTATEQNAGAISLISCHLAIQ